MDILVPGVGMFASAIRAPSFTNPGNVDNPSAAPDEGNGKNLQLAVTANCLDYTSDIFLKKLSYTTNVIHFFQYDF